MKKTNIITRQEVYHIKKKYRLRMGRYVITEDNLIDVNGDVHISCTQLKKLPLSFGKVSGDFCCSSNKLTSLKGSPSFVGGSFNCYGNSLKSLEGGPKEVGGSYFCHENVLTSLKGSPQIINGNFACFLNQLTSLLGGPVNVGGNYDAYFNSLITLEGAPVTVGSFFVAQNKFTNLIGLSQVINDTLSFGDNVTSLYMGDRNCNVNKVIIFKNQQVSQIYDTLSQIVIDHEIFLPTVLKYNRTLAIWDVNGNFNESDFGDIIFDIKDGLR
jgi:hypothetical protein